MEVVEAEVLGRREATSNSQPNNQKEILYCLLWWLWKQQQILQFLTNFQANQAKKPTLTVEPRRDDRCRHTFHRCWQFILAGRRPMGAAKNRCLNDQIWLLRLQQNRIPWGMSLYNFKSQMEDEEIQSSMLFASLTLWDLRLMVKTYTWENSPSHWSIELTPSTWTKSGSVHDLEHLIFYST